MKLLRQGDVLLEELDYVPAGTATTPTVALGEISGHHHTVYGASVVSDGLSTYVVAPDGAVLRHDDTNKAMVGGEYPQADHLPIEIPAGNWRVRLQRQFDYSQPFGVGATIKVID